MRAVIQRVSQAAVTIDGETHASIDSGLLIFIGIGHEDDRDDIDWLVRKIQNLRIFSDNEGRMNLSVVDVDGALLVISQFTLHASTRKGNRPSFINAAKPEHAIPLYEAFVNACRDIGMTVQSGVFGADMKVSLVNDGPVTIIMDTKVKE